MAVIALGAVLAKLRSSPEAAAVAAVAIVSACGVFVLAYGAVRYYTVARNLDEGQFQPATRSPALITVAVVIVTAIVVPLLLA